MDTDHHKTPSIRQPFLNRKRLLAYPYLFLIAQIFVLLLNIILRDGWVGGISGIFGFDFLVFYSSGELYRQNIDKLYDLDTLAALEQELIMPTSLEGGFNVNSYPPYVALLTSTLTIMPYLLAYLVWVGLSLLAIIVASRWLANRLLPYALRAGGLTSNQMLVILLSSFPIVSGLEVGQNSAFTLLLVTGVVVNTIEDKPFPAGVMAGFLIYKPQFVLGFLVLWLVWREYRALLSAGVVATIWAGAVLVTQGVEPYINYLNQLQNLFSLPFGVSQILEVTPLALLATLLPENLALLVIRLSQALMIAGLGLLAWLAHRLRNTTKESQYAILILAGLYPFIAAPHVLLYDLAILAPLFVLLSHLITSRWLLYLVIGVYQGSLLLVLMSQETELALLGIFPILILVGLVGWFRSQSATFEPAA